MFYVKVVGRDSWATLLPVRLYQAVRFRDGPADGPVRSVRSSVEHEAMCALMAFGAGVSTPRLAVLQRSHIVPHHFNLALTRPTRAALHTSGCIEDLRDEVQRVTGANAVPVATLERIRLRSLVTITMLALAIWTLVPQFVGISAVWGKLADPNWWWLAAALGLSAAPYLGAAFALNGSLAALP